MDKNHRRNSTSPKSRYTPFFHELPASKAWGSLTGSAVKVFMALYAQIQMKTGKNGRAPTATNNGDLSAGPMMMKKFGGPSSPTTVAISVKKLLDNGFIVMTEKRRGGKKPNLYALTCFPISDMRRKPFITPTNKPSKGYLK